MTKYEALKDNIQESDSIYVETHAARCPAQSLQMDGDCAIFFDENAFEAESERLVALAHEKGHCDSGAFYNLHTPFETCDRCEHRAWKRAITDLIPFDQLIDAIKSCWTEEGVSPYDLADHLGVTLNFVYQAIEQYVRWGKLIL